MLENELNKNKSYFEAKYNFLSDYFSLTAWVDKKSGKQKIILTFEKDGDLYEESINCIHTCVVNISPDEYNDLKNDDYFNLIKSSENLKEINLVAEEKFKALKSWVSGIAESGMNAFKIQYEFEQRNKIVTYPLSSRLLNFVSKYDHEYLPKLLTKIEKECQFEGTQHIPSLTANMKLIAKLDLTKKDLELINNFDFAPMSLEPIIQIYKNKFLKLVNWNKEIKQILHYCYNE